MLIFDIFEPWLLYFTRSSETCIVKCTKVETCPVLHVYVLYIPCADGGQGVRTPTKNHKNMGFLSNTSPDTLKITKLLSQHSILGSYILMAFRWQANDDPLIVVFRSYHQL